MSGADLANLLNEAAILCAQRDTGEITLADLEAARDKVRFGKERKSMVLKEKEREMVAYPWLASLFYAKSAKAGTPIRCGAQNSSSARLSPLHPRRAGVLRSAGTKTLSFRQRSPAEK